MLNTLIFSEGLAGSVRVLCITASLNWYLDPKIDEKIAAIFARITDNLQAYTYLPYCFGAFRNVRQLKQDNF